MSNIYYSNYYFAAWLTGDYQSSLVEVADARSDDFGTQLLDLFKQHARITYNYDDSILPMYIDAAIKQIEQVLEFPILPRSFDWNVGDNTGYEFYQVPFRNTDAVGQQYDFEPLRGNKIMAKPLSFPVTLKLGFDDADAIPSDLKLFILDTAATLEQLRSTQEISTANISPMILTRYGVLRC